MKPIVLFLAVFLSPAIYAAPKMITCSETWFQGVNTGKHVRITRSILETDDFKKDSPVHEATLLKWEKDGVTHEIAPLYTSTAGKTYRLPFAATPTTLSLKFRVFNESSDYGLHIVTLDIARKDLSTANGSCTIEDYAAGNAI